MRKRLWLVALFLLSLVYWFLYLSVLWRFVIDYERVIFFSSILFVILTGFGMSFVYKRFEKIKFINRYRILDLILILSLVWLFTISFSYTQIENWRDLKLKDSKTEKVYYPAAPANNYLHKDDLILFSNISDKRFLSLPWKGLVIGVATDNYPIETKPSLITNQLIKYSDFINLNCSEKTKIAEKFRINYIYSEEFNCGRFIHIQTSSEGLYLYKFEF